jgi:tRNA modification GTPase
MVNSSFLNDDTTIAAIATAAGMGGVGVIRISGPDAFLIAQQITQVKSIESHRATLSSFSSKDGQLLDRGLLLGFRAPKSFTGEDVVEFQLHGGPALLQTLLEEVLNLGARMAMPGEFTYRAFINNKLDLTQAEAVSDIINASTKSAVINAANSLKGDFSNKINNLLKDLIDMRMYIEACLDFPEEEIDFIEKGQIKAKIESISQSILDLNKIATKGQIIQDGFQVCLVGIPNVGKSTLINLFSKEEVAIVTDIPGTTRDPVRASISLNGIPINFVDTAGIRETNDVVEKAGIDKTRAIIERSALVIVLLDDESEIKDYLNQNIFSKDKNIIWVINKIDLSYKEAKVTNYDKNPLVYISAKSNLGIDLLENEILKSFGLENLDANEQLFSSRQRHLEALKQINGYLFNALEKLEQPELVAEELLLAQKEMSSITGEFSTEDLLGEIFSRFCIGK